MDWLVTKLSLLYVILSFQVSLINLMDESCLKSSTQTKNSDSSALTDVDFFFFCGKEVQAEREVLQQSVEKLNQQLGRANNKVDDLRRKAETAHASANEAVSEKVCRLEQRVTKLQQESENLQLQVLTSFLLFCTNHIYNYRLLF